MFRRVGYFYLFFFLWGMIKSFKIKFVFGDFEERLILLVFFFCGCLIDLIGMRFFKGIFIFGDDWFLLYYLFVNFDNIVIVLNEGVILVV